MYTAHFDHTMRSATSELEQLLLRLQRKRVDHDVFRERPV